MTCIKLLELYWNHCPEEHTSISHPVCWELRRFDMPPPHHKTSPYIFFQVIYIYFYWGLQKSRIAIYFLLSISNLTYYIQSSFSRTLSWPFRSYKNINSSNIHFFLTFAFIGPIVKKNMTEMFVCIMCL